MQKGNKGWFVKSNLLAVFMRNVGVRERVAKEYFDLEVKAGAFEEGEIEELFRSKEAVAIYEKEKNAESTTETTS